MVETVVEAEVASEEVSKIIEALTRTTEEEAETSIKEVAIISTLVVEVALTRWEIPKEDSNLKIANLRVQAVVQTTKLSCADILSFVSKHLNSHSFLDGNCRYENKCSYAHGEAELRQYKNSSGGGGGSGSPHKMNNMPQPQGMAINPMGNMDMGSNVGNFPVNMMMPGQMGGFPANNMYMDPSNLNMQMMFAANAAAQGN